MKQIFYIPSRCLLDQAPPICPDPCPYFFGCGNVRMERGYSPVYLDSHDYTPAYTEIEKIALPWLVAWKLTEGIPP